MKYSKLFICNKLLVFAALLAAGLFAACSSDEPTAPDDDNKPPEVVFTVAAVAVPKGNTKTLTVNATDPDGDEVSVQWEATRGEFTSPQGNPSISWKAPSTTGRDTITISASDGKGGTKTITETILVGTVVASGISTVGKWELALAPYIVRPDQSKRFFIGPNATLTVEAGCEVLIDGEELEVWLEGTINANGTADKPVVIRPNIRRPEAGYWQGITGNPNSSVPRIRLTHAQVTHATEAVKTTTGGQIALDWCTIMFASEAAVLHQSTDSLRVAESVLTNNLKSAIRIRTVSNLKFPPVVISGDSIAANGDVLTSVPYIDQAAIYISMPDTHRTADIFIDHNEISLNGFPAIQLVDACYPKIEFNLIEGNNRGKEAPKFEIRLDDGFGGGTSGVIDASWNYWGQLTGNSTVDSTAIKSRIRDSEDVGNITIRVAVDPWLNAKP